AHANRGDTIEIRGNGPFLIDRMELKNLTIRAGPGYAPVLKPSLALAKTDVSSLLEIKGPVTLEGLELHHEGPPGKPGSDSTSHDILGSESGPLYLANCKLVVKPYGHTWAIQCASVPRGQLRNCLIVSPSHGMALYNSSGTQWTVDNCLIAAAQ